MADTISNMMNASDLFASDPATQPLMQIIQQIMDLPDDRLNDDAVDMVTGMVDGAITSQLREQMVNMLYNDWKSSGLSRAEARADGESTKDGFTAIINELQPSLYKRRMLSLIFDIFNNVVDQALLRYEDADIVLPMTLEEDAQAPTYAHASDAAADLYAADDIVLPAHSISNMIRTGVHIALPEGWMAMIFPRSSIGAKTGLRLSNSAGIIDSHYRGPLGVLYDNISDSDYTIHAGDRIAQLMVMPSYHFKANVVDFLDSTDRDEGGFGSSGK